ncbi:MAG: hypothetical protein DSZ05_04880 [Sulfurospirillum sp.]|nr:MAG: hypothetical protein DSZ05_04880 [Sulfurospirillum sp.]
MKKIILSLLALIVIAGGIFAAINAKSNYDSSKYSASVEPAPLKVGSKVDFTLPDQFDKSHTLEAGTSKLIMTFAKASSHVVRNFLKEQPADFLLTHEAEYVADIHPMPTIIRNAFAMPDLRKSRYPVLLIYEEKIANMFKNPSHEEDIMIVTLENKTVKAIDFVKDAKALKEKLH